MKNKGLKRAIAIALLSMSVFTAAGQAPVSAATAAPKLKLLWAQDFNGKKNERVDRTVWNYEYMVGPNGEKEYYTSRAANSAMDGQGNLVITARTIPENDPIYKYCLPDVMDNCWYTSARLNTSSKVSVKYGMVKARIKMPSGAGVWPAFWMLGRSLNQGMTWPDCGEIDIVEAKDSPNYMAFGTAHGPGYSGGSGVGDVFFHTTGLAEGFHTYSIIWKPNRVEWYFDNKLYHTITPDSVGGNEYVFNQEFFIIVNLAMGGHFTGNIDAVNNPTAKMYIDYIRVFSVNGVGKVYKH